MRLKLRKIRRNAGILNVDRMKSLLAQYCNKEVVDAIARESRSGRALMVGTVNLDAGRPVIWDIGIIAGSDHPERVELIQRMLLASCSIPLAFPPVFLKWRPMGRCQVGDG